ncbi:cytotoxic translational repressor of toxin-antitoxin stability system [archaeon]|nr:cytotoxic translational repressor of toxin-antitoxin stability system [archaeon]|tara:strand:+ start:219 stop:467 length:249 start_codon:yes stop_codon:yes gene_type:complete
MYSVVLSGVAKKQLSKISKKDQDRIVKTLERIRVRPYARLKKLVGNSYFRLRVGDYRIIVDVRDNELVIFVIELGHRKNIYN